MNIPPRAYNAHQFKQTCNKQQTKTTTNNKRNTNTYYYDYKTVRRKLTPFLQTPLSLAHREHSPWVCVCVWGGEGIALMLATCM